MGSRFISLAAVLLSTLFATSAPALKPVPNKTIPLAGTTWVGNTAEGWEMTIEFVADGSMNVSYKNTKFNRASWKQDGDKIYWEMNGKYCEFNGKLADKTIEGESHNVVGKKWETKMTRVATEN
jgi:hypothetical protein